MKYFSVSFFISFESAAAATIPRAMFSGLYANRLKDFYPSSSISITEAMFPILYT